MWFPSHIVAVRVGRWDLLPSWYPLYCFGVAVVMFLEGAHDATVFSAQPYAALEQAGQRACAASSAALECIGASQAQGHIDAFTQW